MLILSRTDVEKLLSREHAREAVVRGAVSHASGLATTPPRVRMHVPEVAGEVLVMPGHLADGPLLGMKVVTAFPGNEQLGIAVTLGAVLLLDPATGTPVALVDGSYLTDVRTAAITAVACQHLARSDSRVLSLIGTGGMARAHVEAIADVLPIEEIRVWSRSKDRVDAFVRDAPGLIPVSGALSAEAAVRGADVVIAATTSSTPVIKSSWVDPGVMVCGIGSHTPDAVEIDARLVARASAVVVDTWQGAVDGAGDVAGPLASGALDQSLVHELGAVISGRSQGRQSPQEITVFKGVGFAAVDLVAAAIVLERALEQGVGQQVEW